ncbi:hypothetical protein HMPREF6745_1222 [Prevotella sp. oral taxon 472 str. F0295]|nr:hypothetical protein HMPREF6745_1222 [Prevotella sp. oral taxon 472 str. F0295]
MQILQILFFENREQLTYINTFNPLKLIKYNLLGQYHDAQIH